MVISEVLTSLEFQINPENMTCWVYLRTSVEKHNVREQEVLPEVLSKGQNCSGVL